MHPCRTPPPVHSRPARKPPSWRPSPALTAHSARRLLNGLGVLAVHLLDLGARTEAAPLAPSAAPHRSLAGPFLNGPGLLGGPLPGPRGQLAEGDDRTVVRPGARHPDAPGVVDVLQGRALAANQHEDRVQV